MSRISDVDESRRNLLLALLAGSTGIAAPAFGAQLSRMPSKLKAGQFVYRVFGDVRVNGLAVTLNTQLKAGDLLTTGDKSFLIFVFESDAFILRSNSEMSIRTGLTSAKQSPSQSQAVTQARTSKIPSAYSLKRGKVLSVMASRRTDIGTPSAVISIRGTGVYVEAEPDESYVCVCYGATEIVSALDRSVREDVVTTHHDAPKYVSGGKQPAIRPAPFKNHDDEELLLIETLVGRTTPFFVPRGATRSRSSYF